ncbi:hypothetical protein F5887DRAFT_83083 [Amanita rubescens]|nr:hypothetical protein F5887DRAFT_83083 [Amanita rubescens]
MDRIINQAHWAAIPEGHTIDQIIDVLERKLISEDPGSWNQGEAFRIVKGFQNLKEDKDPPGHPFSAIMHCEAVIAALAEYFRRRKDQSKMNLNNDKELREACLELETGTISVSKLCCPVCWHLLTKVLGKTSSIQARGCHSVIYPVVLPDWLSQEDEASMLQCFRQYLRRHLIEFITEGNSPVVPSPLGQSRTVQSDASGISTSSSNNFEPQTQNSDLDVNKPPAWYDTILENLPRSLRRTRASIRGQIPVNP